MSTPDKRSGETILVVEDEVLIRLSISEYLRHCGYRVVEAASTEEAIVVLERKDIRIDIVFSNVETPGRGGGFALAQWLRSHRPDVEIVLAANLARAVNTAAELCESGPHLKRPYEPQIVLDRIRQLLAARNRSVSEQ